MYFTCCCISRCFLSTRTAWLIVLSAAFSGSISLVAMSDDRLQDWEREAINSYLSWKGGKGPIPYVNPTAKGDGKGDGKANPKREKGESMCKGGKGDGKHGKNPEGAKAPGPGPPPGKGSMRPPEPVTKGSASSAPPPLGAVSATPSSTGIRPKQRPPAGSWVSAWLWLPSGTVLGSLPGTPGPPPAAPPPAAALPRDESSSSQDRVVFLAGAVLGSDDSRTNYNILCFCRNPCLWSQSQCHRLLIVVTMIMDMLLLPLLPVPGMKLVRSKISSMCKDRTFISFVSCVQHILIYC